MIVAYRNDCQTSHGRPAIKSSAVIYGGFQYDESFLEYPDQPEI